MAITHGQTWDGVQNLVGWWLSEKMDGMRAYWDGLKLLSRHGKEFKVPAWFFEGFPRFSMDGELWMGRGTFDQLASLLNSVDLNEDQWRQLGYYVFDLPRSTHTYEERMEQLRTFKEIFPSHIHIVESVKCSDREHLNNYLELIIEQGGEGLMARQPGSCYTPGLVFSLLKVKVPNILRLVIM